MTLAHIHAIHTLKARSLRLLDTKQWIRLEPLFTDGFVFIDDAKDLTLRGRDAWISWLSTRHSSSVSVHHATMPEIEMLDEHIAEGFWAMSDEVRIPDGGMLTVQRGFGHYADTYELGQSGWAISRIHLTRLYLTVATETLVTDR